jgi:transposase
LLRSPYTTARPADVPGWLLQAEPSGVPELRGFARGLRQDEEAVLAAFRLPWSQGQVEGQINRLKALKRSRYGRASLDLLSIRFLSRE